MPFLSEAYGESIGSSKHKDSWEIDSVGADDDDEDEEFIIV